MVDELDLAQPVKIVAATGLKTSPAVISGTATGGSNTTIVDTNLNAYTNDLAGHYVVVTSAADGQVYESQIASNTDTTLTILALPNSYAVVEDDTYSVYINPANIGALDKSTDSIASHPQADSSNLGACLQYYYISNGSAKNGVIKASAGRLYSLSIANTSGSAVYVRIYNKATAPGIADTPVKKYVIPAGQTLICHPPALGSYFSAGISWRITTGIADDNDVAVSANDVNINADYV
jgi:hypothetical protein